MADNLLSTLVSASEKASRIARLCRENQSLFSLLIQQKGEKNNEIDFKTLADVFIQQTVTKEVNLKFGKLADKVRGEENNQFTNTLGETITVEIGSKVEDTTEMLTKVLDGNESAGKILAEAAHADSSLDMETVIDCDVLKEISASDLDLENIGVWIDPIDCTSQYVRGIEDAMPTPSGIYEKGLQCVMVLIGVYNLNDGKPIMGVINQPFYQCNIKNGPKRWSSRCIWGFSYNGIKRNNLPKNNKILVKNTSLKEDKNMVVLSVHDPESSAIMSTFSSTTDVCLSRGAGYKCATVVDQLAELFVYNSDGSYKWDTCAPHAILDSCGGGIAVLNEAIDAVGTSEATDDIHAILDTCQVKYNVAANSKANRGGLIVYNGTDRSYNLAKKVLKAFHNTQS